MDSSQATVVPGGSVRRRVSYSTSLEWIFFLYKITTCVMAVQESQ